MGKRIERQLTRVKSAIAHPSRTAQRLRLRAKLISLSARNRFSRTPVTGSVPVVVSLTSYGHRVSTVFAAIESIARAHQRPQRMILWLAAADRPDTLPPQLARLQRRGLEVRTVEDFGPHKKQYPYAVLPGRGERALVVADDDVFYPRSWLADLVAAHRGAPQFVHGYRAHRIHVDDKGIGPYSSWTPAPFSIPSFAIMCTGVGGIIYPATVLDALAAAGEAFRKTAPRADDVWVHSVCVRAGIRTVHVPGQLRDFPAIPGSQMGTLQRENVRGGGNDVQIQAAYDAESVARIRTDAAALEQA